MIRRVLVANRGEIAVRVIRAARAAGISPVAVHSAEDRGALFARLADAAVEIGPGDPAESYLNVERLLDAARRAGCDAVHPGYGFLSESATFAEAVAAAGLVWVGPPAGVIRDLGNKRAARRMAASWGVATVPGFAEPGATDAALLAAAPEVGFPLLVKAAAGGGGKGMRVVGGPADLPEALARARREARAAFGDDELILERYLSQPRHVEVQILADAHGTVLHLGERDCSIQRRHQKIIEESPAPLLSDDERDEVCRAAVRVAEAVGYVNAGTVEFLRDGAGRFYFLEVNTRVQVEHPVTEMRTGIDIVRWQFRIADGERLAFRQQDVRPRGWAIEARVCAEDADADFVPRTGRIRRLVEPAGPWIRVDSSLWEGQVVGARYDSLLAKVVAWGEDRREAAVRLSWALSDFVIAGCHTNVGFLRDVIESAPFGRMELSTDFLSRHAEDIARRRRTRRRRQAAVAAAIHATGAWPRAGARPTGSARAAAFDPWEGRERLAGWRLGAGA